MRFVLMYIVLYHIMNYNSKNSVETCIAANILCYI